MDQLEQKQELEQIEEVDVDAFAENWYPKVLFKPIEYCVKFENKDEFVNMGLLIDLQELLAQHAGTEDVDWFIEYSYHKDADHGIKVYCEELGWMVMVKLLDPENRLLPKIKRIEKRIR